MKKPVCKLVGQNGNIYNLIGLAAKALIKNGQNDKADEMKGRVFGAMSYSDALCIIMEYVEVR